MSKLGVNRDNQKKINRGLVLKLIATQQCVSRIEISKTTGLTKTAISQIVGELIGLGYLAEVRRQRPHDQESGRTPVELGISADAPHYAGVLIERESCQAVLVNMQLKVLRFERINKIWTSAEEVVAGVYEVLDKVLEGDTRVAGIGAASIGPVDVNQGRIVHPFYFNEIENIAVRKLLEERYGLPVYFDHDNQSAVLAEHLYGNGRGYQDIVLVGVGSGVGCGVLVDGKRVHSYSGYAPEIGHTSIDYRGIPCPCGNVGCLERYINITTVTEEFRQASGRTDLSYSEFCAMAETDPALDKILSKVAFMLAMGIVNVLNMMNSQIVLLTMGCSDWPDKYIEIVEKEINQRKFGNSDFKIKVMKAAFLDKSQVLGAACNAIDQVFMGELL